MFTALSKFISRGSERCLLSPLSPSDASVIGAQPCPPEGGQFKKMFEQLLACMSVNTMEVWSVIDRYGQLLACMAVMNRQVWTVMDRYGQLLAGDGSYEEVLAGMGCYGQLLASNDSFKQVGAAICSFEADVLKAGSTTPPQHPICVP